MNGRVPVVVARHTCLLCRWLRGWSAEVNGSIRIRPLALFLTPTDRTIVLRSQHAKFRSPGHTLPGGFLRPLGRGLPSFCSGQLRVAPLAATACVSHLGAGFPFSPAPLSLPRVSLGSLACLPREALS